MTAPTAPRVEDGDAQRLAGACILSNAGAGDMGRIGCLGASPALAVASISLAVAGI